MKQKVYVSPSAVRGKGYSNRYFYMLKEHLSEFAQVLEADNAPCRAQSLRLLKHAFKADVFILSFVENIPFHKLGFLQYLITRFSLWIMRLRKRKLIFIYHNIHPYLGENWMTRSLMNLQLKHSCKVFTHSKQVADFARRQLSEMGEDTTKVQFFCHPVPDGVLPRKMEQPKRDVLIWGQILPYKGVREFVSSSSVQNSGLKVLVMGSCPDERLANGIKKAVEGHDNLTFENRRADFSEIEKAVVESRYVLFPYRPGSIASSGVLIDTVAMGGNPVGPNVGAFKDLAEEGVCLTYTDKPSMLELLKSDKQIDWDARKEFLSNNSWRSFASELLA